MKKLLLLFTLFGFICIMHTVNADSDTLFFDQGSHWKYLDDGSDPGTAWQMIGFDDSAWLDGQGPMGFGGEDTLATLLNQGFASYFFRKIIEIGNVDAIEQVFFHVRHNHGAVVYVNGQEMIRSYLMPEGDISYVTTTTAGMPDHLKHEYFTYQVDPSVFQTGINVLAVSVHNVTALNTNLSFDCYVSPFFNFDPDGPYVFYRNNQIIVKEITPEGPLTTIFEPGESITLTSYFAGTENDFSFNLQPELSVEPSEYVLPSRFLAISDIEGEIEALIMVLEDAGVIDHEYNWAFGDGHLFFVGDMFDRGSNVAECLWLLYKLESEAVESGGKIHFVIGNHEMMYLTGDFRYVNLKYLNNYRFLDESLASLYAADSEAGRWLRTKNLIEKAGSIVFVHGGLSHEVTDLGLTYNEINELGRYRMDSLCNSDVCNIVNGIDSPGGIYWYRGMAQEELSQLEVDQILHAFASHLVVIGHTVFDSITLLYDHKVICIDLPHTDNFANGYMSALYYEDGKLYEFRTDGITPSYKLLNNIAGTDNPHMLNPGFRLDIHPNPANNHAHIRYAVPSGKSNSRVQMEILNPTGRMIELLVDESQQPGDYEILISTQSLTAGFYLVRLCMKGMCTAEKMLIIR
ncbi:MAG: metallophosphoesterase [Bacteroidales bacterium]